MADWARDLRISARTLRRNPLFTLVTLLTLALAIGANTAIFSLIDPLVFRSLPVREPGRLVQFTWHYPGDPPLNIFSLQNYEDYRARTVVLSEMAGLARLSTESPLDVARGRPADAESIRGEVVTGNFFQMLGVRAAFGRVLEASDDTPGAAAVAVVSSRYWKSRFNRDSRVVGAPIDITDSRLPAPLHATIVGVAEPRFSGVAAGYQPDVWVSLAAVPQAVRSRPGLSLVARLKSGATIEQAQAEMRVLDRPRIEGFAQRDPQWRQVAITVRSARSGLSTPLHDQFGGPLVLLMATVGVLLLLACANIGGLLLARGAARRHEIAVRVSLGAGRFRIARELMAESLLLACIGSLIGVMGARFGAGLLMRIVTSGTRSLGPVPQLDIALDARVLLFTVAITGLAAVGFGLAPALAAFVSAPASALRERAGGTQPRSRRLFGSGLVVGQVALSLALLSVSQLFIGHLSRLRDRSLGFDREGVLVVSADTRTGRGREQLPSLYADTMARLQAIPGVRSVSVSGMTPISGAAGSRFVRVEGFEEPADARRRVSMNNVSPNYFATLGTPLVAGRDFRDADADQPRRVIVNQAMARKYFAGRDPIGQPVWFDDDREPHEIVGLAGDAKYQDVRTAPPPTVYVFARTSSGPPEFSLRTSVPPASVAGDARRVIGEVFGSAAVRRVTTLADQVDASIVPERLMAMLSGFFGAAGALLAAVGLYGLLAYMVARRTREIGIRVALGATRGDVIRMVLTGALGLVIAGIVAGAPIAFWGKRLAASVLEQLPSGGAVPVMAGTAAVIAVALLAAYVPARRATRIDPMIALRSE